MSARPELLWPLFAGVETLDGIGPKMAQALEPAITRVRDMLYTLPTSVVDRRLRGSLGEADLPGIATVEVEVISHLPPKQKGRPYRVMVRDSVGPFAIVFFHAREDYLKKQFPPGAKRIVSGKAEGFAESLQMVHPEHILLPEEIDKIPQFEPVYPLNAGVTQKVMWRATRSALALAPKFDEWIDTGVLRREGWPSWHSAITEAHTPVPGDTNPDTLGRTRLAYDELLAHQLTLALARAQQRKAKGRPTRGDGRLWGRVLQSLPYAPTGAQNRSLAEIRKDMEKPFRMNRLLQGDVGAGKTLVALGAMLTAVEAGGQAVLMAPTEILARQHFHGLEPLAAAAGVRLALLTGRDKGRARAEQLAALQAGQIDLLVGTHAVFQKDVEFHDLRLAIIDEQHRFGVAQRLALSAKGITDVLVMTATPIPRSLALAHYGDMDLSVLDEKPPGRQPITTALIEASRLEEVVGRLKTAIAGGAQCYWVCPLVEESEVSDLTATEARFETLRAALGEGVVGLVHGKMPAAEKDAAMADFEAGRTRLLVATTVIEVGVNVPAATIMVIERAEAFGLAQLHQLRGRVGRGSGKSTCLLMYQAPLSKSGVRRLSIMRETEDGFRIAEEDLQMRGAGDMIGTAQSGLPQFRIANLERQGKLMELAQNDARVLLAADPDLTGPRGRAARHLLWLMEQDRAFKLLNVG